jgi:two-component system, OmpR family, phosphate regulon sensor histidine kinase PhoR
MPEFKDTGVDAINALVTALQPLDDVKTQALRTAAHELRTPLTTVAGYVELLADPGSEPMTDDQHHILRVLARNVRRLVDLVDALDPTYQGQVHERARP